ncbi:MAG: hypothetical protein K9H49_10325 [Bacteroidales bacterium]|nr:hypothetical protein [Bacteroidales bacterium]MCF8389712.1 hypothetical protein [Bacteroidales bacterium]
MKRKSYILLIIIAGFVLCYMGFYNNYPLLHSDSGTYIKSGFLNQVPPDRPLLYGLFIRHISMAESLYFVILAQGVILSLVVFYYFKYFLPEKKIALPFISFIFIISFFTGASLNVSQLIPDIFTGITILSLGLLFMVRDLKKRDLIILLLISFLGIGVHNSHLLIAFSLLLTFTFLFAIPKIRLKWTFLSWRRLLLMWSLIIITYLGMSTINYSFGSDFKTSKGGHVFFMARLIEIGVVSDYLDNNCDKYDYRFCEYKDQIPWDFIWDYENSPLYKTGGWEANEEEYKEIILDIMTTPKYLKIFVVRGLEASFKQFFSFETGNAKQMLEGSAPYGVISRFFPDQLKEYVGSRQSAKQLDFRSLNTFQLYLSIFSLLAVIILLFLKFPFKWKVLSAYILYSVYINAAVCGAISFVAPRYQSRVIWLLVLPVMLTIIEFGKSGRAILNQGIAESDSINKE